MDGNGDGQHVGPHDRMAAAARLTGGGAKTVRIRESVLAGASDEHPLVQAAAFYRHHADGVA